MPEKPWSVISASASDSIASGPMVNGLTTMPDSNFLTWRTWAAWPVDIEIAMDDADAAGLRHRDRHARFGDGVHRGGDDRDIERDRAGHVGADIGLRGQDIRKTGLQKHIVEREGFAYSLKSLRHCQLLSAALRRDIIRDERRLRRCYRHRRRIEAHQVGLTVVDSMAIRRIKAFASYAQAFREKPRF